MIMERNENKAWAESWEIPTNKRDKRDRRRWSETGRKPGENALIKSK